MISATSTRKNGFLRGVSPRWVLVLCAALLLWNLGYATIWNPDEGYYAAASLEMAHGFNGHAPDWIVPHLNTITRLNKPPLVYWLAATFFNFFGVHEWAARLGSALFSVAIMLMLWQIARRAFNERTGIFAAMIWSTALFSFGMSRFGNTDMLLCGSLSLALFGLWRAVETSQIEYSKRSDSVLQSAQTEVARPERIKPKIDGSLLENTSTKNAGNANARAENTDIEYSKSSESAFRFDAVAFLIAGAGMGLALLAKGPVGMIFPLAIAFFYLLAARRWNVLWNWRVWAGVALSIVLAVALATPWYLAANAHDPQFLQRFVLEENFGRFSGGKTYHNKTPITYYLPVLILGLFPWTPLLLAAFCNFPRRKSTPQNRALIFAWIWAAFIIVLFSLSSTKLVSYVLPAFPALAILCASALDRVLNRVPQSRKLRFAVPALVVIANAILLAGCAFGTLSGIVVTKAVGAPYLAAVATVLVGGILIFCVQWRKFALSRAVFSHFATYGILFVVLLAFAGRAAPFADSSPLVASLKPYLRPDEKVVVTMFQPTAIFYSARPITTIGFRNASGLNDAEIARSPLFLSPEKSFKTDIPEVLELGRAKVLARVLDSPQRVFALMRRREFASAMRAMKPFLTVKTFIIGRNNDYLILSNRAAPDGYVFDFVAPKAADKEFIYYAPRRPKS